MPIAAASLGQVHLAALRDGRLGGAGLDVAPLEPLPADHPLVSMPNVIVVPHTASATIATRDNMASLAARNLLAVLEGDRGRRAAA